MSPCALPLNSSAHYSWKPPLSIQRFQAYLARRLLWHPDFQKKKNVTHQCTDGYNYGAKRIYLFYLTGKYSLTPSSLPPTLPPHLLHRNLISLLLRKKSLSYVKLYRYTPPLLPQNQPPYRHISLFEIHKHQKFWIEESILYFQNITYCQQQHVLHARPLRRLI